MEIGKKKEGRPSRTLLEIMQTKAWLSFILKSKNANDIDQLDRLIFNIPADIAISRLKLNGEIPDIRWDKYKKNSSSPNESILKRINQEKHAPGSLNVFQVGLYEGEKLIPIWRIFEFELNFRSHESENLWKMVDTICDEMPSLRNRGAPYLFRIEKIAKLLIPDAEWKELDFANPTNHPSMNAVVKAYRNGYFEPSLQLLAGAMAMWRIALDVGESMAQMEYLVRGLLSEPFAEILSSHDIYSEFLLAFNRIEINNCIQRGEFETATKIIANLMPS